jgi:hypothetical protein
MAFCVSTGQPTDHPTATASQPKTCVIDLAPPRHRWLIHAKPVTVKMMSKFRLAELLTTSESGGWIAMLGIHALGCQDPALAELVA